MTTIKFRRDTSTNWTTANPIPAQGEPCYETDTGKLKIGNGSDYYSNLPYVSDGGTADLPIASSTVLGGVKIGDNLTITEDGVLSASGGSGGTTDYTQLENKPQINSIELTGDKTLDDLGIQAKGDYQPAGDYLKTSQAKTAKDTYYSVYLYNGMLQTAQPNFTTFDGALGTNYVRYLKAATYSTTEPDVDDMTNNWTDKKGFLSGYNTESGYISGTVTMSGTEAVTGQVLFKLMEADGITAVEQAGTYKFDKIETSTDGTTYTEFSGYASNVRYVRFTYTLHPYGLTYFSFLTRIRTNNVNIAGGWTQPLSVKVDGSTIKIVSDKLVANIPTKTSELTNDSGFLTEAPVPDNMVTTDTSQTITGVKTFDYGALTANGNLTLNNSSGSQPIEIQSSYGTLSTYYANTNTNLLIMTAGSSVAKIDANAIQTIDASGNVYDYINTQNIDTTYMKINDDGKLSVDTAAVAHLAMPSGTTVNLTLGASGATYTAPADGYISFIYTCNTVDTAFVEVTQDNDKSVASCGKPASVVGWIRQTWTCPKDMVSTIKYTGSTSTASSRLRFTYAVGAVPTE